MILKWKWKLHWKKVKGKSMTLDIISNGQNNHFSNVEKSFEKQSEKCPKALENIFADNDGTYLYPKALEKIFFSVVASYFCLFPFPMQFPMQFPM